MRSIKGKWRQRSKELDSSKARHDDQPPDANLKGVRKKKNRSLKQRKNRNAKQQLGKMRKHGVGGRGEVETREGEKGLLRSWYSLGFPAVIVLQPLDVIHREIASD